MKSPMLKRPPHGNFYFSASMRITYQQGWHACEYAWSTGNAVSCPFSDKSKQEGIWLMGGRAFAKVAGEFEKNHGEFLLRDVT